MVLMLTILKLKPSYLFFITPNRPLPPKKRKKFNSTPSISVKRNQSLMVKKKKKKPRQFSSKQFSVQFTATSPSPSDLFSLSLSHFSCDSCEASANPETPSENKVSLLVCCLQGIHLPDRHSGRGKRNKEGVGGRKRESKREREATCYQAPRH